MTDHLSKEQRSALMARIRSKNTAPEMAVRRLVHGMGYRYRLHRKDLPGSPDLTFPSLRKVIFVHGCYWHLHQGCRKGKMPASPYWAARLTRNARRDRETVQCLQASGWGVLIVWECEVKSPLLDSIISGFLGPRPLQLPSTKF